VTLLGASDGSFWQCRKVLFVFDLKNNIIVASPKNSPATVGAFELLNDLAATQSNITLAVSHVFVVFKHV